MTRSNRPFRLNNGRLCFVFAATLSDRGSPAPLERLRCPADLGRWCVEMGFASECPEVSEDLLTRARALREAIVKASLAVMEKRPIDEADLAIVNDWASRQPLARRLSQEPELLSAWVLPESGITAILAQVAADCVDLLSGELAARIKTCANPDCRGVFVDVSRPGMRRWCSMGTCGNKAKKLNMALREQESH